MTIEKQLYKSFGAILLTLVALLVVDVGAILKARSANAEVTDTLESVRAAEAVRDQIMQNRLNLNNFLLSGDPRDEDKVNHGLAALSDVIKRGQSSTSNDYPSHRSHPGREHRGQLGRQFCQAPPRQAPSGGRR